MSLGARTELGTLSIVRVRNTRIEGLRVAGFGHEFGAGTEFGTLSHVCNAGGLCQSTSPVLALVKEQIMYAFHQPCP